MYTGTHDNDTLCGWYKVLDPEDLKLSQKYMNNANTPKRQIHWDFIRLALASVADMCIIPLQDYLGLGSEARNQYTIYAREELAVANEAGMSDKRISRSDQRVDNIIWAINGHHR